jgi:tryptophanyl-tRNA synthetase
MSKSYGNAILLSDPEPEIRQKLKTMVTDPARVRRTDPGNPEVCPVFSLHKIYSSPDTIADVVKGCTTAGIGCIQCKTWVADNLITQIKPLQERRAKYEQNPQQVWDMLEAGSARAAKVAEATMTEVRKAMKFSHEFEPPTKSANGSAG